MSMLGSLRIFLTTRTAKDPLHWQFLQVRHAGSGLHKRWKRAYLKDLFHRRVIAGPEPLISRSSKDNWFIILSNYTSEISALSHRLHIPEADPEKIVQALTDRTFFERKDISAAASQAQPSKEDQVTDEMQCNDELVEDGMSIFRSIVLTYLRAHWPKAPEEFIIGAATRIASNNALTEISNHLGIQHVARTGEFPPSDMILHTSFFSLITIMDLSKARSFVYRFVLPRLYDVPLEDVLPFRDPFSILCDYMRKCEKVENVEPRLINSGGLYTPMPYYEIAIYANKERLLGQSVGEQLWVALDLASQNALLRLWKVLDEPRVFPFKFDEVYSSRYANAQSPNHSLKDVCSEKTDINVYTNEELAEDPIDPAEMARQYYTKIRPVVGEPHRRRLKHMFHKGTIQRFTKRAQVVPRPHNI